MTIVKLKILIFQPFQTFIKTLTKKMKANKYYSIRNY
jgi:hypothetical protein